MYDTQNTPPTTPLLIKELYQKLDRLDQRALRSKAMKFLGLGRKAVYDLISGTTPLSSEGLLFFARYFDSDPICFIPKNRADLLAEVTRIKEEAPDFGKKEDTEGKEVAMKVTKRKSA